jgi:hypothetical protein
MRSGLAEMLIWVDLRQALLGNNFLGFEIMDFADF